MNIAKKYEDVVAELDGALAREEKLRKELESALAHEDSMREELGMVRKAVPNSTLELVSLHQRLTVAECERDAALAREAEVGRLYDSLVKRSNRERDASYKREDALRNDVLCLEKGGQLIVQEMHYYRKRLTVAEQLLREIRQSCELSKLRDSQIDAALKPAADAKSSPPCPNCKVCMGSPDFPENCLINGIKP